MPTKLAQLRSQLNHLLWQRAAVRWGSAACALLAFAMWLLVAAFLFDWTFNLPVAVRALALTGWCIAALWSLKAYAWPLLKQRESVEDVALLVERHHKIDSDLVAALQFESPGAGKWGSTRLSAAVVDYVAEFSPSLNVFAGFSYRPLPRRLLELGLTLLIIVAAITTCPAHVSAFWNRFLLGSAHYPTKTRLEKITVNGNEIPIFTQSKATRISIPQGQPIIFDVTCGGIVPPKGFAHLSSPQNELNHQIELNRHSEDAVNFVGELSHALDSFRVRFQFGDASSDAAQIEIVPLPLVDITWEITPPAYAKLIFKSGELESNSRQSSVLEGSRGELKLVCSNKSLKSAQLKTGNQIIPLTPAAANPKSNAIWQLPSGTPFDSIHEAIKYEIQVVDQDGFSLSSPIAGQIRLKNDRLPRIVATIVTRQVLPTATPKIDYVAVDDFGIAKMTAQIAITREDGRSSQHEIVALKHSGADPPQKAIRGQVAIPLSQYELTKGDEVKVILEVTDWRGDVGGQKSTGETTSFNVTDLNGILAQTGEEDKKTAKELDEILRRELGIGGEKK